MTPYFLCCHRLSATRMLYVRLPTSYKDVGLRKWLDDTFRRWVSILIIAVLPIVPVVAVAPESGGLQEINQSFRGDWHPGGVLNDPELQAVMRIGD